MTWKDTLIAFGLLLVGTVICIDIGSDIIGKWLVYQFPDTILSGFGLWLISLSVSLTITIIVTCVITLVILMAYVYIKLNTKQRDDYY
jgi:hypothetical protein